MAEEFRVFIDLATIPEPDPQKSIEVIHFEENVFLKFVVEEEINADVSVSVNRLIGSERGSQGRAYMLLRGVPYYTFGNAVSVMVFKKSAGPNQGNSGTVTISYSSTNFA